MTVKDVNQKYLIDYSYLTDAQKHYSQVGYNYVDAPWFVSDKAMNITVPAGITCQGKEIPVASGEQSFLQLALDKKLPVGKHYCVTPCLRRSDPYDDLHCQEFMKLELIYYFGYLEENIFAAGAMHCNLLEDAKSFFNKYLPIEVRNINDMKRLGCVTENPQDIEWNGIELGSYGIRHAAEVGSWIYGTGVALPRLQIAIQRLTKT
jgi:aspartyl/asparaginyl-tRNA synthetase